jgi:hypothetical protein
MVHLTLILELKIVSDVIGLPHVLHSLMLLALGLSDVSDLVSSNVRFLEVLLKGVGLRQFEKGKVLANHTLNHVQLVGKGSVLDDNFMLS